MSSSASDSGSRSSSEAIVAHFDEAAGVLVEGGYDLPSNAWDSITRALLEETIDEISFWGTDGKGAAEALLRLRVDWKRHQVAVENDERFDLPLRDGTIHLYQVRRAAQSFLRAFSYKHLEANIRLRFRPEEEHRREELNLRYGWHDAPTPRLSSKGDGWQTDSRYHSAINIEVWFGD